MINREMISAFTYLVRKFKGLFTFYLVRYHWIIFYNYISDYFDLVRLGAT